MKQDDCSNTNDEKNFCVSVFKSGENTTTKQEYTRMWIELINLLERSKSVNFCKS